VWEHRLTTSRRHQQTNSDVKIGYSEIEILTFHDLYQKKKADKSNNISFTWLKISLLQKKNTSLPSFMVLFFIIP